MATARLDKIRLWDRRALRIWALEVAGESEVWEFFESLVEHDPVALTNWLRELDQIGSHDHFAGEKWFKKIRGWPDQWEVRRGDHRLLGFRTGNDLILCLHRVKDKAKTDRADLARVNRLAREWKAQHGPHADHPR